MTHNVRAILTGLILAWLVGYFARFAVEVIDWFDDVASLVSLLSIFLILRWLVGKVD